MAVVFFLAAATWAQSAAPRTVSDRIATMDTLWARRATPGPMEELIRVGAEALAQDPTSYAATWRVGRAHWWIGHTTGDLTAKAAASAAAMRYGEAAMQLAPDGIEGHFLYAVSVGEYGASIGTARAVMEGIGQKFERASLDAYALDRDYSDGGPIVALGRYYYILPWPLRDLNESRRYLEEARQRHPRALWGRVYLAQTYYALGQERAAKAELRAVLALDPLPNKVPDDTPAKQAAMAQLVEWYGGSGDQTDGAAR